MDPSSMTPVTTHNFTSLRTIVTTLGVAAAYAMTGKLGLLLAIPPGYATAIWPPSGLALAATLMYGYRVWPGIVLGSVLVNIGTSLETTSLLALLQSIALPASIGMGAALQASLGAYLVRRSVGFPSALNRERDIGAFLVLGGPVSCLVNATLSVTTLLVSGKIPWALYPISWWTWWVGDTIGVFIVTPFVLSWLAEPRQSWRRRRLSVTMGLVTALALAVVFFVHTSAQERERLRLIFERQTETLARTLQTRLEDYLGMLYATESFFASVPAVTRHEFHIFVQGAFARHPGLQALSFDRRVPDAQRAAYEEAVRRDGYADFQVMEEHTTGQLVRAAQRPEYVAVYYIEPYAGNEKALGFDVASEPGRLDALHRARDTGKPVATGRLTLVQETGRQFGWLVFMPLYGHGLPHATVEERRQHLQGYITGVFRISAMVEAVLRGLYREGIALRIEDETAPAGQQLLYDSQGHLHEGRRSGASPIGMHWDTTVEMAGRRWVLRFVPTLEYFVARQSLQPWTVLVGGLLFTSLLGAFLLVLTGRAAIVEQLVVERTAELSRANATLARAVAERHQAESRFSSIAQSAIEAIISTDDQGHILTWNNGACAVFGYREDEVVGQRLTLLMPERYREAHQRGLERMRATDEAHLMGKVLALHGLHKDGREFPIELTLSTWTAAEGRFYGGIIRDVTERKRAEEAQAHLAAIVESSDDAIMSYNLYGMIVSWNAGAEAMFGYTCAEAQGQALGILRPPDQLQHFGPLLERLKRGEYIAHHDVVRQRKDGVLIDVSLAVSPIRDAAGQLAGGSSIYRDITERKRAEEVLHHTATELARSNADLQQFAYAASHDLQEPLRGVAGCVQLLARDYRDQLDARAHELIAHAVAGAARMQTLISDLLAYSRVSTRTHPFEPVNCALILQDVQANLAVAIQESQASVTHEPLPTVMADATQLLQVFQNLLSNAIKFRSTQPPAIHIGAAYHEGAWVFAVRDHGIGIAPQHAERIFIIFQRLHTRNRYPGTGIGLALCKKIIERHGGRIWVESEPGKGATFFFTIPDRGTSLLHHSQELRSTV